MKTSQLVYAIILGVSISVTVKAQNLQYHISGNLQNIPPIPSKMYLKELVPLGLLDKTLDSAQVTNGKYEFFGKLNVDEAVGVMISPQIKSKKEDQIILIIDKGDLQVSSEGQLNKFVVSGGASLANQQFDDMKGDAKKKVDSLNAVIASDAYKTDKELQAKVRNQAIREAETTIFNMYTYVKEYPENRITPFATLMLVYVPFLSQAGKDTLITLLPERVKEDRLGQIIVSQNDKNKKIADSVAKVSQARRMENLSKIPLGSKAIEITESNPKGEQVSLTSLKGKYVLVDFWASWCAPCRAENPNVVKLYKQYKDKGFTVFGISLDGTATKGAWVKAIENDGLSWTQVSDLKGWGSSAAKAYGIESIPQNFLLDPNGVVIAKNLRGDDLAKELASIFNK
jgi:thiol-disulfide isomerase/thioredoxin